MTTLSVAAIDFEFRKFNDARLDKCALADLQPLGVATFFTADELWQRDYDATHPVAYGCVVDPFTIEEIDAEQRDGTGCENCGVPYVFHKSPADLKFIAWYTNTTAICRGFTGPDDDWIRRDKLIGDEDLL